MDALTVFAKMTASELRRPALVTDDARWSFADLAQRTAGMVQRLEKMGIREGSRAAVIARPVPEVFVAIHALAAIGATLVPIHPRLSPEEARLAMEVAAADLLLDEDALELPASGRTSLDVCARAPVRESTPFAIVATSGTTGRPKGAVLSRSAFVASAEASAANLRWEPDDQWLCCMPLAHVGGLSILTRCLLARRAVVLLPRFDAAHVLDAIQRHRVTLLSVVPTMLHALIEKDAEEALRLPRALLVGGAAAPAALLEMCAARGVRALATYGLTEACSQVTSQQPRDRAVWVPGSGAPLQGFDLRIEDEAGAPLPLRHAGRILVRGPALFDGYLSPGGRVDPFRTGEGFFDTGDIGELDDEGQLHVHARRTDLIVTGGENVYPAEVEQAIERCAGVRRALVVGVPDERWGQVVAAAIEPCPGVALSEQSLIGFLSEVLAPHKRPRIWLFVNELPLTSSGKVDRREALSRWGGALSRSLDARTAPGHARRP